MLPERRAPWESLSMSESGELRGRALYDALMHLRPADLPETEWAVQAGVNRGFFTNLKNSEISPRSDTLRKLLHRIGKTEADLYEPSSPASKPALPGEAPQPAADTDDVALQEWDIAYGMGGGSYLDLPVTGTPHTFSRQWLRNFTHAPPDKIFLARGAGDSMSPTILDADMVIIDTSEREIRVGDKIWAVVYGTTGFIKRIRPMPDGSVKLLSDNPNVPAETAYDGELSVVGRVVAVVRKT